MHITTEHNPFVSIIIPVKNGSSTLDACLRSIKRSYYKNYEIIVVDDHSSDNTREVALRHQCTVLAAEGGEGANYARNFGAKAAKGDILVFIDADVMIRRETILEIVETLEDETTDAVVGIYTARHRNESLVSQYKNLWIRYSYLKSPAVIDWMFGATSGIKRKAFEQLGGFNNDLMVQYGDEIELGKRAARSNLNIVLNLDIEIEHLKYYTLRSFIKNEFQRSMGFVQLASQLGETTQSLKRGFINVYPTFVVATIVSVIVLAVIVASVVGALSPWYAVGAVVIYLLLNIRFLNYLEQVRGLFAMIVMIPILFLDQLVCFIGSGIGLFRSLFRKKKS